MPGLCATAGLHPWVLDQPQLSRARCCHCAAGRWVAASCVRYVVTFVTLTTTAIGRHCDGVTPAETDRFYVDFGRRVRAAREQSSLTQQALADALGLTRSSVANIEAGRQRALLHMTAAVAAATGVPAADLLPGQRSLTAPPSLRRDLDRLSDTNRQAVEMLLRRTSDAAEAAG